MGFFSSQFWRDPPGHRFRRRYFARHRPEARRLDGVLRIVGGAVLVVVGAVFCVLPGPGLPPLILGAALIAGESLPVARWLDSVEMRLRRIKE